MSGSNEMLIPGAEQGKESFRSQAGFRYIWKQLIISKTGMLGSVLVLLVVLIAICAPLLTSHDPAAVDPLNRLKPPAWMDGELRNIGLVRITWAETCGAESSMVLAFH